VMAVFHGVKFTPNSYLCPDFYYDRETGRNKAAI
jgi:hypothetical protein